MIALHELVASLDGLLQPELYDDYAPNGLQIEGRALVRRVALGVSANAALIDQAIGWGADALLVHHGFFWRGESPVLTGYRGRRVGALMRAELSLLGYHLPLDAHEVVGNNAQVLARAGAAPAGAFGGGRAPIGRLGGLPEPEAVGVVVARLEAALGQRAVAFLHGPGLVRRIAVVTGGGARYVEAAIDAGADLFVTGEPSEQSQGIARECGANFVALGHHATERVGVQAAGAWLAQRHGLDVCFFDVPNPV